MNRNQSTLLSSSQLQALLPIRDLKLSREEQQQTRAAKPVETLDELTTNLRMDDLAKPTTLVEIQNAIREIFGDLERKVNPEGDGEKVCGV